VYQPASGSRATVTVNICNTTTQPAYIRMAMCVSGTVTPSSSDFIEFNRLIPAGDSYERTGLAPSNQDIIYVYSNVSSVSVVVWGYKD